MPPFKTTSIRSFICDQIIYSHSTEWVSFPKMHFISIKSSAMNPDYDSKSHYYLKRICVTVNIFNKISLCNFVFWWSFKTLTNWKLWYDNHFLGSNEKTNIFYILIFFHYSPKNGLQWSFVSPWIMEILKPSNINSFKVYILIYNCMYF